MPLGNALLNYREPDRATNPLASGLGSLLALPLQSPLVNALLKPERKRKAYFAFLQDIIRVNKVRKAWCIDHPNSAAMRSFYDRSIWGDSKSRSDDALKEPMRRGVEYSAAICVLVGTNTWKGRWVKMSCPRGHRRAGTARRPHKRTESYRSESAGSIRI